MKPAPFTYHRPASVAEALELLGTLDNARVLAGGQSLVPMLNLRIVAFDHLIDIGRIAELCGIQESGDRLRIGAMTTQRTIEKSAVIGARCPLLAEALLHVGHQQTRNRGTMGGSLCHLDPAAEMPVVATALDAVMRAASRSGVREIPFSEFALGYLTTQLEPDEILLSIDLPVRQAGTGWAFEEFARRPADFAIASVAVSLAFDAGDRVHGARIAIGGLDAVAIRLRSAEEMLAGQPWSPELAVQAAAAAKDCPAEDEPGNPAEYRRHLAGVLTRRALHRAFERRNTPSYV